MMKRLFPQALFTLSFIGATAAAAPVAEVVVTNAIEDAIEDQVVDLRLIDLGLELGDPLNEAIVAYEGDRPVPAQAWDRSGDGVADTVSLLLDLEPTEAVGITLSIDSEEAGANAFPARTYAEISRKFGGEWNGRVYEGGEFQNVSVLKTPKSHTDHSFFIRYEGPGWESEKVSYRFYLDWRNGFDIFGKLTPALVLKDVGLDGFDSYHEPEDWGMDILKVGNALGSGGYGLWVDGKVERISKTDSLSCRILENGSVLSQFEAGYHGWQGSGQEKMDLVANLSIQAGSRITWVRLRPDGETGAMCAGLVKAEGIEKIVGDTDITGEAFTYIGTWGPQSLDGSDVGIAILVRKKNLRRFDEDDLNNVAVFREGSQEYEYGFLAAWSKEPGGITSKEAFEAYLKQTARELTLAPRVDIYSSRDAAEKVGELNAERALYWTKRMADSILQRRGATLANGEYDPEVGRDARWTYTTGLMAKSMNDLAQAIGESSYADWAEHAISSYVLEDGTVDTYDFDSFNIDQVNSGKMLLELHRLTGEERYRKAADHLRQQLVEHPRTKNGAFWHKKRYPWQVWLDGVYMGIPFMVGYELAYNNGEHVSEAVHEFLVCEKQLRDKKTGLYYHAWDEAKEQVWADKKTGQSKYFWGRGLGWYAMALVDVLEMLPEDSKDAAELRRLLNDLAEALVKVQDEEKGVWYQILDMPDAAGNYPESSCSVMFTYMLAKGVNQGWLDDKYAAAAKRGFEGVIKEFVRTHADGTTSFTHLCRVAGLGYGRDGSYEYYMSEPVVENDPKGIGPFVMAGMEVSRLLDRQ